MLPPPVAVINIFVRSVNRFSWTLTHCTAALEKSTQGNYRVHGDRTADHPYTWEVAAAVMVDGKGGNNEITARYFKSSAAHGWRRLATQDEHHRSMQPRWTAMVVCWTRELNDKLPNLYFPAKISCCFTLSSLAATVFLCGAAHRATTSAVIKGAAVTQPGAPTLA